MAGDERIAANRWDVAIHVFALQLVVDNVVNGPRNPIRLDSATACGCRRPVLCGASAVDGILDSVWDLVGRIGGVQGRSPSTTSQIIV